MIRVLGAWILAGILAGVLGCSRAKHDLVGTWSTSTKIANTPTETLATFEEGGRYRSETDYIENKKVVMTASNHGTWKLKENRLEIRLDDVTWELPENAETKVKEAAALFRQNKQAVIDSVNKAGPIEIRWITPDEIQCTVKEGAFTYKRKR